MVVGGPFGWPLLSLWLCINAYKLLLEQLQRMCLAAQQHGIYFRHWRNKPRHQTVRNWMHDAVPPTAAALDHR